MHTRGTLLTAASLLAAGVLFYAADTPQLPPPYATKAVNNRHRIIPEPTGAKLKLPPGFHMEKWAEDFNTPRFMLLGPSNEILMTDSGGQPSPTSPANGTIYVFPGLDPAKRKKIIE